MMKSHLLALLPLLAIPGLVSAECKLHNAIEDHEKTKETRTALCQTQGKDSWTFAMDVGQVSVPTFDGKNPFAGIAGHQAFIIYDHNCVRKGVYAPENEDNDCGVPYVIQENWLPYVLTVTRVNFGVGDGDFKFSYANGEYMIGENGASCRDISSGLYTQMACGTAFPLNGEPV